MGPQFTVKRPAFHGYYDGHKDTYLNTDVSSKTEARMMHIHYAPVLKSVPLKAAPEIYLVQGKAAAGQLALFGSEPGESSYSPIWKETILSWKAGATPVLIKSDTQVDKLEKKECLPSARPPSGSTARSSKPARAVAGLAHRKSFGEIRMLARAAEGVRRSRRGWPAAGA